ELGPCLRLETRMARRRGMGAEALRVAEIVRDVDEPERVEKAEASFLVAGHVKADEAAALLHLATRQFVLRVTRQARVQHPGDLVVGLQLTGDRRGGAALSLDPQLDRLGPSQQ